MRNQYAPSCEEFIGNEENLINLEGYLLGNYLTEMPYDPKAVDSKNTQYTICINKALRVVINAPNAETRNVSVTK